MKCSYSKVKRIFKVITILALSPININSSIAQYTTNTIQTDITQDNQDVFKFRHDELTALLNWAAYLSGYKTNSINPNLQFKPHQFFVDNACMGNEKCNVLGWYNDLGIVYIDDRLVSLDSLFERSLVVHEFVHYLQHLSGKFSSDDCEAFIQREREAYSTQREFIIAYGVSPSMSFYQHSCAAGLAQKTHLPEK